MTPQERKVIELALEALGTMDVFNPNRMEAITALRQAIAEAEKQDNFCDNNCVWTDHHPDCKLSQQEPEWYHIIDVHGCNRFYHKTEERSYMSGQITPLYTTPPQPVVNQSLTTEPVALQMDVIVVNLVREGINKHRARELAEHFIKHTTPPQRKPFTDDGYNCVICGRFLLADEYGVILHDDIEHPPEMTFDDEERPQ